MSALLNPAQREAIRYLDGPCLVIAGAGSGKTRVITHKIIHLIDAGIAPRNIAAITFTNKAAQEMAERLSTLKKLTGDNKPLVSTFHSLGVQIMRRDGKSLGLKKGFSIIDSDDAQGIIQESMATTDRKLIRLAASRISLWKSGLIEPAQAAAQAVDAQEHSIARVYADYAATLTAYQAVDFDDLIRMPVLMFREHPDVLQAWREKLRYLLVDEYQDTNASQYELMKQLAGPRAAFTAVGDDDQSIYGWRGATLENLRQLGVDFPNLRVIKLEQNYRSTISILTAANHLIQLNPKLYPKTLWSEHGVGDPIQVIACDDDEQEAESVVARLQAHKFERRTNFNDYAILYRGNHQARILEQALRKEKIPYVLSGGQSFFDRAEIRDLISYLRLLVNDDDDPAFIRAITTPKRGVGVATLQVLGQYAGQRHVSMFAASFESGLEGKLAERQLHALREFGEFINRIAWRASREPAAQVIDDMVNAIDYRAHIYSQFDDKVAASRWQNVSDFIDWLKRRAEPDEDSHEKGAVAARGAGSATAANGATLLEIAQSIALLSQLDRKDKDADVVRMTTIHASKGLEFPHVFIVGCEEGLLPHRGDEPADDKEAKHTDNGSAGASGAAVATGAAATAAGKAAPAKRLGANGLAARAAAARERSVAQTKSRPAVGGSATVRVTGAGSAPAAAARPVIDSNPARTEEERRLMYVAVTRAERSLTLTWCRQRKRTRDLVEREPSRFIGEMKLQAMPESTATISEDAAKEKLARLRAMLSRPAAPRLS